MKKALLLLIIFNLLTFSTCPAPSFAQQDDKHRIKPTPDRSSKYKVYVPANLEECFVELKKMLHPELINEMRQGTEADMIRYHHGLGTWIRNNWGLWGGSRLAKYFNSLGVFHPDDMSGIILDSFWRHLNGKPLGVEEKIQHSQAYWKAVAEPKPLMFPECPSGIKYEGYLTGETSDDLPRAIHFGHCKADNSLWVFEHRKGWYKPDAEIIRRIETHDGVVSFIEVPMPSKRNIRKHKRKRTRINRRQ